MIKTEFLMLKNLIGQVINHFKTKKNQSDDVMLEKPKKSIEYSNLVRRLLLLIFTAQWVWLMWVSERMYIKNGDIGDNWTKLMISVVGLLTLVCGFYFSGQYSDRNSEEFKRIKQYDNDRLDEYHEEVKQSEEVCEKNEDIEITPKAILEEDEDNDA